MIVSNVIGRRLAVTYQQVDSAIIQRCKASTASPQVATKTSESKNTDRFTADDVEWKNAKSFDELPGFRVLPVIGTLWAVIGILYYRWINR